MNFNIENLLSKISTAADLLNWLIKRDFTASAPINIEEIINMLGISMDYYNSSEDDTVGSITRRGDEVSIKINTARNGYEPRKRFTIAHELGHLFNGHLSMLNITYEDTQKTMSRTESYWDIKESEANAFAAKLLMPKEIILNEGKKIVDNFKEFNSDKKIGIDDFINKMADKFQVSNPAMKYRLKNLRII